MKKILMTLLVIMLVSGGIIAVKKKTSGFVSISTRDSLEVIKMVDLKKVFFTVLLGMHDTGGKVHRKIRRKIQKQFKKKPIDPELRAIAFFKVKQKKTVDR